MSSEWFVPSLRCAARAVVALLLVAAGTALAGLPELIDQVKPSIVVVGTYARNRNPAFVMRGTGFVVGNGSLVATNDHVVPEVLDVASGETLMVLAAAGQAAPRERLARVAASDKAHDLVLLRIDGAALPALRIQEAGSVREGQSVAYTGFPIGTALGLTPVTHRGMISAITPIALPAARASQLNESAVARMRTGSFNVYQLDGTAYPGNSGGPLYEVDKGEVVGIVNMVFVKGAKESALSNPSGISFAVPVTHLQALLREVR